MQNPKILIVDDQESVRSYLKDLLTAYDPIVVEASDGKEAADILSKTTNFNLVLSDIEMPEMNGFEFCDLVKGNKKTKQIPFVFVSSFDNDFSIDKGFESGADGFVSKSSIKEQLNPTVSAILERSALLRKKNILVADDSPLIRKIVEKNLTEAGFLVQCVTNGREALAKLSQSSYDLILSDLKMPEMDGIDLCAAVKADSNLKEIPFVAMTASEERKYVKRLMQHGLAGFIVKPFLPDELLVLLERIFSDQYQLLLKEKENLANEREMMIASITSLVFALEARDKYTQGHSESVAEIVTGMAAVAQFNEDKLDLIHIGATLHDIGKIGVRDAVLLKEGKLTDQEYKIIQSHSQIGARIINTIPSLSEVVPMILHHHEKYDGTGYPHGLKGTEIPFWARMTAVADTYDAMTSDRPYRNGLSKNIAYATIQKVSGTQLCPECVELFFEFMKKAKE